MDRAVEVIDASGRKGTDFGVQNRRELLGRFFRRSGTQNWVLTGKGSVDPCVLTNVLTRVMREME